MNTISLLVDAHIASAVISIIGFIWRWQLALRQSAMLGNKVLKIVPHIVDTVLLVSGFWMCILIDAYPFTRWWLTAKLLLLVVYIGLGTVAIKRAKNDRQRWISGLLAIAVFAAITAVAYLH
ncbi:SirB2 family protein [Vibrio sp. PP-XX7]